MVECKILIKQGGLEPVNTAKIIVILHNDGKLLFISPLIAFSK
tara:strand:- start:32374 stop:32502 length:129 start_codon:yes stop_codon:yes gene_type:complete